MTVNDHIEAGVRAGGELVLTDLTGRYEPLSRKGRGFDLPPFLSDPSGCPVTWENDPKSLVVIESSHPSVGARARARLGAQKGRKK